MKTFTTFITSIKQLGMLTVALTLALLANFAYGQWTGPGQAPTGGNVSVPINVGGMYQYKAGNFGAVELLASGRTRSDLYCDYANTDCINFTDFRTSLLPSCLNGQVPAYSSVTNTWGCASIGATALPTCAEGEILKMTGGLWTCAADEGGTVTTTTGPYANNVVIGAAEIAQLAFSDASIPSNPSTLVFAGPDGVEAERICELKSAQMFGSVTPITVLATSPSSFSSPGDNYILDYNGSSWSIHGATSPAPGATCSETCNKLSCSTQCNPTYNVVGWLGSLTCLISSE